jgi:hypothetical protein
MSVRVLQLGNYLHQCQKLHIINDCCFVLCRKPRLNQQLVAQQVAQTITPPPPKPRREDSKERKLHNLSVNLDGKISKKKIRNM